MADADRLIDQLNGGGAYSFSRKLISLTGIATVPGTAFYHTADLGNNQVRLCFAKSQATLEEICLRLNRLKRAAGI
jgi:aminotransferase